MKQFAYILKHNIIAYLILLSLAFLQSCRTKVKQQAATAEIQINISSQPLHSEKGQSEQEVITADTYQKEITKEAVDISLEHQETKEERLNSTSKLADEVLVQHATANGPVSRLRQRSLKYRILHNTLLQERNRLIANNINSIMVSKAPHGQTLIRAIHQALKTKKKDTLIFEQLDLQEQDFIQLSYHPFFREKCKKFIYFDSVRPLQNQALRALGKSLQGTQIKKVHLAATSIDSSAIAAFLADLKHTNVCVLNLSSNGLTCDMVEVSNSLIGTSIYSINLSNNLISIPLSAANIVGRNLYRSQVREIDLMANPIESETEQFLSENFNIIDWKFLRLIFLELF
jgi:hypothetical protein